MSAIDPDPSRSTPLIAALTTFFVVFIGFWLGVVYVDHEPFIFDWHPMIRLLHLAASVIGAGIAAIVTAATNATRR